MINPQCLSCGGTQIMEEMEGATWTAPRHSLIRLWVPLLYIQSNDSAKSYEF